MAEPLQVPKEMTLEKVIVTKTVSAGLLLVEVALVKTKNQYEAAVFLDKKYKPGPPLPLALPNATTAATHWMCARPRIGFTEEEATKIIDEVLSENRVKRIAFKDTWGADMEEF